MYICKDKEIRSNNTFQNCSRLLYCYYSLRVKEYVPVTLVIIFISVYTSGLVTVVAVFRKPNAIPLCLTTDLLLKVLFSWLLVHLPSTFFRGRPRFLLSPGVIIFFKSEIIERNLLSFGGAICLYYQRL
jgi:hypothetical protein